MEQEPYRVLIAKPGLDGHERGARVVARILKQAGMEVVYTGIRCTPEMIAEAAERFQAEVVGLSVLSGAHLELVPRVMDALQRRGVGDTVVLAGGIIPERDRPALLEMGVAGVFGPGSRTDAIVAFIKQIAQEHRRRAASRR